MIKRKAVFDSKVQKPICWVQWFSTYFFADPCNLEKGIKSGMYTHTKWKCCMDLFPDLDTIFGTKIKDLRPKILMIV